jgi:hypothetical protein
MSTDCKFRLLYTCKTLPAKQHSAQQVGPWI